MPNEVNNAKFKFVINLSIRHTSMEEKYNKQDVEIARQIAIVCQTGRSYGINHFQKRLVLDYDRAKLIIKIAIQMGILKEDPNRQRMYLLNTEFN